MASQAAGRFRWTVAGGLVCLIGTASGPANAQSDPLVQGLEQIIDRLDADDFATREQATSQLEAAYTACRLSTVPGLSRIAEEQFLRACTSRPLTPEQQARILKLARERFMASERAGVGIQWDPQMPGLVIARTIAGFPCHDLGLIRPGDVVVSIEGQDMSVVQLGRADREEQTRAAQALILAKDPGEKLSLDVLRPANRGPNGANRPDAAANGMPADMEPVGLLVPLGRFSDLQPGATPPPDALERAWSVRLQRAGVIDDPDENGDLLPSSTEIETWRLHQGRPNEPIPTSLTIGHMSEGGLERYGQYDDLARAVGEGGRAAFLARGGHQWPPEDLRGVRLDLRGDDMLRLLQIQLNQTRGHYRNLESMLRGVRTAIGETNRRLEDPSMLAELRARLEAELGALSKRARALEKGLIDLQRRRSSLEDQIERLAR